MSNYPTSLDDQTSLYNPADSFSTKLLITTLGASCISTDTTIQLAATVASLGGPAAYGIISIDDEEIVYTGSSTVFLTGCIRGSFGTTAVGHSAGVTAKWRYVAGFDKALQSAVEAIQATLGVTGSFNFVMTSELFWVSDVALSGESEVWLPNAFSIRQKDTAGNITNLLVRYSDDNVYLDNFSGIGGDIYIRPKSGGKIHATQLLQLDSGAAVNDIVTTVGSPGSDSKLATEKAIRTAINPGVNLQTGTSYTVVDGDRCKLVSFTNGSAIAATLPQAGASSLFISGWSLDIENRGAGALTITPTTSTIDGAATLVLNQNQGCRIFSDGTNYFTQRGVGGGSSSVFSGCSAYKTSVTFTSSPMVIGLNNEDYDTDSYHDNVTNNSRFTVPATGKYSIKGQFFVALNGNLQISVHIGIKKNGTLLHYVGGVGGFPAYTAVAVSGSADFAATASDYFEFTLDIATDGLGTAPTFDAYAEIHQIH